MRRFGRPLSPKFNFFLINMLITVPDLIRATFTTYGHNFRTIMKYLLSAVGVYAVLMLNAIVGIPFYLNALGEGMTVVAAAVTQLLILAIFMLVTIAMSRAMGKMYRGQAVGTVWEEIREGKKVFWSSLIVSFLMALIVMAGMLLLIIPGIIFAIWYYFAPMAAMLDNEKIIPALKTSQALTKGRFGQVFWRLCAPLVLYVVVFIFVSWMLISPGQYFLTTTGQSSAYWVSIAAMILFYFFSMPIFSLTPIILYEEMKRTPVAK